MCVQGLLCKKTFFFELCKCYSCSANAYSQAPTVICLQTMKQTKAYEAPSKCRVYRNSGCPDPVFSTSTLPHFIGHTRKLKPNQNGSIFASKDQKAIP